jgi:NAD(P)-dependent dehydrogenase (short-subunit alcohol dehydrogenase family)
VTLTDFDAATWRHVQAVNVESALWLLQAFTPGMAERGFGRIVFIVSDTYWAPPVPTLLAYVASKGTLLGVMRTLAVTLGADGIAVSAVAPGLTDTPSSRVVNTDEQFDATVDRQALKRRLTPLTCNFSVGRSRGTCLLTACPPGRSARMGRICMAECMSGPRSGLRASRIPVTSS